MSFFFSDLLQTIDSFEDNDLDEYSSGDGDFSVINAANASRSQPAKDGDLVAKFGGDIGIGNNDAIHSVSGLPEYPDRGEDFGIFINPNDLHDAYYHFGVQETRNKFPHSYSARVQATDGDFELWYEKPADNISEIIASTSFDTTDWENSWSEVRIEWGNPTITATCFDSNRTNRAQASADDSRLDSGGVGIAGNSQTGSGTHTAVWFDLLHLR